MLQKLLKSDIKNTKVRVYISARSLLLAALYKPAQNQYKMIVDILCLTAESWFVSIGGTNKAFCLLSPQG